MKTAAQHGSKAITDTRLTHETHRLAIGLLVAAASNPSTPPEALTQLRDFLEVNLRHHHEVEDAWLWPQIVAAAPDTEHALHQLSEEHERLDAALDRLAAAALAGVAEAGDTGVRAGHGGRQVRHSRNNEARAALSAAAAELRDCVRDHLAHEEPVLFPALRDHITPAQWDEFAAQVIATTPPVAGHLMIGFLDEVGTPAEVESMLVDLPHEAKALLPAMRRQAVADLRVLRGTSS
ncbi:hemerythrin domain-containing protein [Streptomyces olivaceus]|uniref:hemerythrin domain-containing protein n=1 Tax=Streptomyces olivaceus TaxID=47716 RepID=UPI004055AB2E